jgi:hypothetical protein
MKTFRVVLRICWINFTLTSSDQTSTNASSFICRMAGEISRWSTPVRWLDARHAHVRRNASGIHGLLHV